MYNKEQLEAAIWQEPSRIMGLTFRQRGNTWQSRQRLDGSDSPRQDKTILRQVNGKVFVNYNGGSFPQGQDVWQFIMWKHSTNDFIDAMRIVGDAYGIEPDLTSYTEEQRKRATMRASERKIMQEIGRCITKALGTDSGTTAREYLHSRHLEPTERLGAYGTRIKERLAQHLAATFPELSIKQVQAYLRRYFPTTRLDYSTDKKHGTWVDFTDAYQLAAPYTCGYNNVTGFWLRCTAPQLPTWMDDAGKVQEMPKYIYSKDMPKGGYCGILKHNEPTILVEGMLDVEAMQQAGFTNVIGMGGIEPTDNKEDAAASQVKTLQRNGIKKVIYVPDYEYNKHGQIATDATKRTIAKLLPYLTDSQDGQGFASIRIANLETEEARKNRTKVDAADFLVAYGHAMQEVLHDAVSWYEYMLKTATQEHTDSKEDLAAAALQIYDSIPNPIDRQRLQADITAAQHGYMAELKAAGMNAAAMVQIDRNGRQSRYKTDMQALADKMAKATTSEEIATLLAKAARIQHKDTYQELTAQVNATAEQLHAMVNAKPDNLATTWDLYSWNPRTQKNYASRKISFTPAAVSLIAAPTNHGKTLILLQTALNLAQSTSKKYLYLSFENDAEQLYIRALTAYIGTAWDGAGYLDDNGKPHPIENPRAEVREVLKAMDMPKLLFKKGNSSIDITKYEADYWRTIAPHLALARMDADIEAIYNNVATLVETWRNNGIEPGGVFIDYLQLLHAPGRAYSRTEEVKAICDRLNDLAKATKLPIIAACQFNRQATQAGSDKLDVVELANIGESAGIENIAEDCYLVWQTDKIKPEDYMQGDRFSIPPHRYRSRRCFTDSNDKDTLRRGYLYIENLKARDYATGGYCLLPYSGAAGCITSTKSEE